MYRAVRDYDFADLLRFAGQGGEANTKILIFAF